MLKRTTVVLLLLIVLTHSAPITLTNRAEAQFGETIYSSLMNIYPVIEGVIASSEWTDARLYNISSVNSTCYLYIKNDLQQLYIALDAKFDPTFTSSPPIAGGHSDLLIIGLDIGRDLNRNNDVELQFRIGDAKPSDLISISAHDNKLQTIEPVGWGSANNRTGNMQYELNITMSSVGLKQGGIAGFAIGVYDSYFAYPLRFNITYPMNARTIWYEFLGLGNYDPSSLVDLVFPSYGIVLSSNTPPKVPLDSPTVGVRVVNLFEEPSITAEVDLYVSSKDYGLSMRVGQITLFPGETRDLSIAVPASFEDGTVLTLRFVVTSAHYGQLTCIDYTRASSDTTLDEGTVYLAVIDSPADPTYRLAEHSEVLDEFAKSITIPIGNLTDVRMQVLRLDIKHDTMGNPLITPFPMKIEVGGDFESNTDVGQVLQSASEVASLGLQVKDVAIFIKKDEIDTSIYGIGDAVAAFDLINKVASGYKPEDTYEKVDFALSVGELLATGGLLVACAVAAATPVEGSFGETAICPTAFAALSKVKFAHTAVNVGKTALDYATKKEDPSPPPPPPILTSKQIQYHPDTLTGFFGGTSTCTFKCTYGPSQTGVNPTTFWVSTGEFRAPGPTKSKSSRIYAPELSLVSAESTNPTGFTWPVVLPYKTASDTVAFDLGLLLYLDEDAETASIAMVYDVESAQLSEENVVEISSLSTKHMRVQQKRTEDSTVITMTEPTSQSNLRLHAYVNDKHIGVGEYGQLEVGVADSWYSGDVMDGTEIIIIPNTYTRLKLVIEATADSSVIETCTLHISTMVQGHKTYEATCTESVDPSKTKEVIIDTRVADVEVADLDATPLSPTVGDQLTLKAMVKNNMNKETVNVPFGIYVENALVGNTQYVSIPPVSSKEVSVSWRPAYEGDYFVAAQVGPITSGNWTVLRRKSITLTVLLGLLPTASPNLPLVFDTAIIVLAVTIILIGIMFVALFIVRKRKKTAHPPLPPPPPPP